MLAVGNYIGIPDIVSVAENYKGVLSVFVKLVCPEQPKDNNSIVHEGPLTGDYAKRTFRELKALGWKGADIATAKADIEGAKKATPFAIEHMKGSADKNGNIRYFAVVRKLGVREIPEHQELPAAQLAAINAALAASLAASDDGDSAQNTDDPTANW